MGVPAIGFVSGGASLLCACFGLSTNVLSRSCGRLMTMQLGHAGWLVLGLLPVVAYGMVGGQDEQLLSQPNATWLICSMYLAYAWGRAVWESTSRHVSAALFPQNVEEIFAIIRFGEGLAATTFFLLCGYIAPDIDCQSASNPINYTIVVMALLAFVGYPAAESLSKAKGDDKVPIGAAAAGKGTFTGVHDGNSA
jgi:hypothetical protein